MQKCTLALGCFWKPEENFKNKPGIIETEVGYAGGKNSSVSYEEVCTGNSGHAEVVRLTFDETRITFRKILDLFFKMHDPTQKDMQFPDVGTQYRSEIFYENDHQKEIANKVNEDFKNLNNFSTIVGIGGGQSLDMAKYFAWKSGVKLFQVPTSMSVNATFGHRAAIRINSNVSYVGWTVPEAVYIDYDIIKEAPKEFNRSGICEIMCYHTAHLDWKYATKVGKCEKKWPYDQSAVNEAQSVLDYMLEGIDDIKEVNDNGIKRLMNANAWGGAAFHNFGWNPRPIEGTDHFVFYSLEYHTKRPYIHGQPVNFGVYLGSLLHETKAEEMFDYILRAGVDTVSYTHLTLPTNREV